MYCARRAMLEKRLENVTVEIWQEFPCGTRVTHADVINRDLPEFFRARLNPDRNVCEKDEISCIWLALTRR